MIRSERFINVRKLVALDIVFHGPTFIFVEFVLGVPFLALLGISFTYIGFFFRPAHPLLFFAIPGCVFLWLTLNYAPLAFYAFRITRQKSAHQEVALELAHPEQYKRMYNLQGVLFLLIPFAMLVLACVQARQKSYGVQKESSTRQEAQH